MRRLVREPLSRIRHVLGEVFRRQFPLPAGAEERPVEEDPAPDVGVDQSLAPARGVLGRSLGRRAEPGLEEAEVALPHRERACRRHRDDGDGQKRRPEPELVPAVGDRHNHCRSKIETEQTRKRRSEHDADDPRDESGDRECTRVARSRVQPGQAYGEGQSPERGELVLAHERALSAAVRPDELDRGPGDSDAGVDDDDRE